MDSKLLMKWEMQINKNNFNSKFAKLNENNESPSVQPFDECDSGFLQIILCPVNVWKIQKWRFLSNEKSNF